jgi:hypothetical protein
VTGDSGHAGSLGTQVVGLEADDRLRGIIVRSGDSAEPVRLPAAALFICIGGMQAGRVVAAAVHHPAE